jgi:circadian clock protein KaiC
MSENVPIVKLDTGVPGLNEVLGGGLPEFRSISSPGGQEQGKRR